MNISFNWLKDYIDTEINLEQLCEIITSTGLEVGGVEKIESVKGGLQGLFIGKVLSCIEHPNSDHLHVTTVDTGRQAPLHIVCGAPNIAAGQKVVVATIGTTLYDGEDSFTIKKSKIRGELSEGMICSEKEIGIGDSHEGILVLPDDAETGTEAAKYFKIAEDYRIEIDITPNRIDGASHWGVARDLAAYLSKNATVRYGLPAVNTFKPGNKSPEITIRIENEAGCKRYAGLCIKNVEIKPSPSWMAERLRTVGLNPVNNIVDITNYVLYETGQPLHAFDMSRIKGNSIVVRTCPEGTPFTTLDGIERKLNADDLMICNAEEPMCIAGVLGGIESGISAATTDVFLECACFDPVYIRKTAKRHGISTDASFRYERGSDPNIVIYALKRAALLITEIAHGSIESDIQDIYPNPVRDYEIHIDFAYINKLIGKDIGKGTIKHILSSLDIKIIAENETGLELHVPPYRHDVKKEADIVEEILRIYGFNNIETPNKLNASLNTALHPDNFGLKNKISDFLTANGFYEIINNSLTSSAYTDGLTSFDKENNICLCNPLSSDLGIMRRTMLFGGLENIAYNINHKRENIRFFEFGKTYSFKKDENIAPLSQYTEREKLALWLSGNKTSGNWNTQKLSSNFYYLKSHVENILKRMGIELEKQEMQPCPMDIFRDGISYFHHGNLLLHMGIVSPNILKQADIKQNVYYAEFEWAEIIDLAKKHRITYRPVSKFPEVKRDLALLLDKSVNFREVYELAFRTEKKLLKEVTLFDVFEDPKLGENKKSYAVSFTMEDREKTLTDKQIDKVMNRLIGSYKHHLGAEIR